MKPKSLATKKTAVWTILLVLLVIGVVVSRSDRTEYFFSFNWKGRKRPKKYDDRKKMSREDEIKNLKQVLIDFGGYEFKKAKEMMDDDVVRAVRSVFEKLHKKTGTPTIEDLIKKNLSDLRNVAYLTKKYNSGVTYPSYNNSGDNYYNYCKHHQVMGLCNNAIVKKSCRDECRN